MMQQVLCAQARSGCASTSYVPSIKHQHQTCARHVLWPTNVSESSHFCWRVRLRTCTIASSASGHGTPRLPSPHGISSSRNAAPARGRELASAGAGTDSNDGQSLIQSDLYGKTATVRFHLKYKVSFGQGVKLLGSHPKLGSWNLKNSVELRWTAGDQWVAAVQLPAGGVYEYKYVLIDYETKKALEWQTGSNAVLAVVVSETDLDVYDNWGNHPGAMVQVDEESMTRETKLQTWANEMMGYWKEARRLQIELVQKNNESQGLRNELAQLRMELSMERQSRLETEAKLMNMTVENAGLKAQLVQKTVELNNTLAEVLQLLDQELEDDDNADTEYYDEDEEEDEGDNNAEQDNNSDPDKDADEEEEEEPPAQPLHQRYVNGFVDILRNGPSLAARTQTRNAAR